jgi:hypothetical protein
MSGWVVPREVPEVRKTRCFPRELCTSGQVRKGIL